MEQPDVSIVIVCMNNYGQLKDCLESIRQYTREVSYEVLLVAYFFSEGNLQKLRREYPWVTIIISDEIRGFSANNNLALNVAKGRWCFVLNDDTYIRMPVVDELVKRADSDGNITVLTPQILLPSGKIQYKGMTPIDWKAWLGILFKLRKDNVDPQEKWIRENGFFQTYNILGAAFLIKTDVFRMVGFLDERYFYGPEDRALSTLLNKKGYKCYVDSDIKLYHLGGGTAGKKSRTACATRPANRKGWIIYLDENNTFLHYFLCLMVWINSACWSMGWLVKRMLGDKYAMISFQANVNVCKTIFNNQTTIETFKKFYKRQSNVY